MLRIHCLSIAHMSIKHRRCGTVRYSMYSMYRSFGMYNMYSIYIMYYGVFISIYSPYNMDNMYIRVYVCTQVLSTCYLLPGTWYASICIRMHSYASVTHSYTHLPPYALFTHRNVSNQCTFPQR